jgi:hypothetical protein
VHIGKITPYAHINMSETFIFTKQTLGGNHGPTLQYAVAIML